MRRRFAILGWVLLWALALRAQAPARDDVRSAAHAGQTRTASRAAAARSSRRAGARSTRRAALHSALAPDAACLPCIRGYEDFLASDALHGRGSGTRDEWIAATYIASQLEAYGIQPAAQGGGYVEVAPDGAAAKFWSPPQAPPGGWTAAEPEPSPPLGTTASVVGVLPGTDPHAPALLLSAHLDHLGVQPGHPYRGDTIFNGANDDASGCAAVLELARMLALGPRPRRTVYFAFFGGEENGMSGSRYWIRHPPVPLPRIFANLEFEMIGWPDPAIPPRALWLTGWRRSDLGPMLARFGARVVPDPRPEQHFFCRSDNIGLAQAGVVAQTASSFGLQPMYHRADDDVAHLDFPWMGAVISSLIVPVRRLLNSRLVPAWNPGGRPHRLHPCARP